MTLTRVLTQHGYMFIDTTQIVAISQALQVKKWAPSRCVSLIGGHKAYVLDLPENRDVLAHVLPAEAEPWGELEPPAKKKTRKAKAVSE